MALTISRWFRSFKQVVAGVDTNPLIEERDLPFWREQILKALLISGLLLSVLSYLPALRIAVREGIWGLALINTLAYIVLFLCLRYRRIKYEYRALTVVTVVYLVGLFIILKVGIVSGGPAWLFSAAVLAGLLLGLRAALITLAINAGAITTLGWLFAIGFFGSQDGVFNTLERGLAAGGSFVFLNIGVTLSVVVLVRGLENTTREMQLASARLKRERAELVRAKAVLRKEVEERKGSEAALRESESRYKLLAENVTDVIWTVDVGLRFTYISPSVEKLLGYAADAMLGQTVFNFLSTESQEQMLRKSSGLNAKLEKNGNRPFDLQNLEIRMVRKDGEQVWAEIQNSFFLTDQGNVDGIVGVARDITKRKEYEEALEESENKYRSILESIDECYYEVDLAGNLTFINRAGCDILGYSKDELIGLNNRDYTTEKTARNLYRAFHSVFLTGQPKRIMDYEIIKKDGESRTLELSTALIQDDGGIPVGFRGIARDITQRKQAQLEKERLENQLLQAEKMKAIGTLAGGVAHDLNNILSGIVSYPELLLLDLAPDSPMVKPIKTIQESGKKAAAIVQDLLTLARRGVSVSEVVNLNDIVNEYLNSPEYQRLLHFHPLVAIESRLESSLFNILGSPHHLSKTVMNLVSNAAEAMRDGGTIIIETNNEYIDRPLHGYDKIEEGDYCVLTVADTGIGIAAEELQKIFEPFYTKKTMGRSGTGLGMAVVWGTVKDHKGYIGLNSVPGKGTVFKLYFPITRQARCSDGRLLSMDDYKGHGERVLIVDDVLEQREIATSMLTALGYQVACVSSGEKALQHVQSNRVDLIVLDMIMAPGMDGLETFRQINRMEPRQKAIITSGFSETQRVREAQRLGAGQYVKKPYSLETIGLAIRNELGRRQEAA
jgi:two-component system, cell cycle sensor histidine kinase and response regulator CckA